MHLASISSKTISEAAIWSAALKNSNHGSDAILLQLFVAEFAQRSNVRQGDAFDSRAGSAVSRFPKRLAQGLSSELSVIQNRRTASPVGTLCAERLLYANGSEYSSVSLITSRSRGLSP